MQNELLQALATIADLKEQNYRLWLSLSSLTEALVARGLLSYPELAVMASSLEATDTAAAFPPTRDAAPACPPIL